MIGGSRRPLPAPPSIPTQINSCIFQAPRESPQHRVGQTVVCGVPTGRLPPAHIGLLRAAWPWGSQEAIHPWRPPLRMAPRAAHGRTGHGVPPRVLRTGGAQCQQVSGPFHPSHIQFVFRLSAYEREVTLGDPTSP